MGESMNMTNRNFQYDQFLWYNIGSGTYLDEGLASMGSGKSFNKLAGVFGRVSVVVNNNPCIVYIVLINDLLFLNIFVASEAQRIFV